MQQDRDWMEYSNLAQHHHSIDFAHNSNEPLLAKNLAMEMKQAVIFLTAFAK